MYLPVKVNDPTAKVPKQMRPGDAGFDLCTIEHVNLWPQQIMKVRTGISIEIPEGHFGLVMSRSSIVAKGVQIGPAIIDSTYRGELFLLTANYGSSVFAATPGDRIAQIVIVPYASPEVIVVDELNESVRGTGGFGSSGTK